MIRANNTINQTYWEHLEQSRELTLQLHIDITGQIFEAVLREGSQLLTSLVALRMIFILDCQERNYHEAER